jgi:hypothetical protein
MIPARTSAASTACLPVVGYLDRRGQQTLRRPAAAARTARCCRRYAPDQALARWLGTGPRAAVRPAPQAAGQRQVCAGARQRSAGELANSPGTWSAPVSAGGSTRPWRWRPVRVHRRSPTDRALERKGWFYVAGLAAGPPRKLSRWGHTRASASWSGAKLEPAVCAVASAYGSYGTRVPMGSARRATGRPRCLGRRQARRCGSGRRRVGGSASGAPGRSIRVGCSTTSVADLARRSRPRQARDSRCWPAMRAAGHPAARPLSRL